MRSSLGPSDVATNARDFSGEGSAGKSSATLLELLLRAPDQATAVILPDLELRLTHKQLRDQVLHLAGALVGAGIGRGDRVAIAMPNGLPAIVTLLASSIAGTAAPLNPTYRQDEFSFFLADTNARLLLCPPDETFTAARKAAEGRIPVLTVETDQKGHISISGASHAGHDVGAPKGSDVAVILHTGGSTGRPKGVAIPHRNLAAGACGIAQTCKLSPADVSFCAMPLFHLHGLATSTLAAFHAGGTVVVPTRFHPAGFWTAVRDFGVTWYSAVPTVHRSVLAGTADERPSGTERLRLIRSGSAAMRPELMKSLEEFFGVPVLEGYGMTETGIICCNPLPPGTRKPGSVGPSIGAKVSIRNTTGKILSIGEQGEVVVQGPHVVAGYENNPEANAASFRDGWFHTGDMGFFDSDGYLTLTGRVKELISRGGEKVSPVEIDEILLSHPDVAEAAAFGVPHVTLGEEVVAAVVLRNPRKEGAILAFCRERLADFKCPKKLYVLKKMPRTATGKIQRRALAELLTGPRS